MKQWTHLECSSIFTLASSYIQRTSWSRTRKVEIGLYTLFFLFQQFSNLKAEAYINLLLQNNGSRTMRQNVSCQHDCSWMAYFVCYTQKRLITVRCFSFRVLALIFFSRSIPIAIIIKNQIPINLLTEA